MCTRPRPRAALRSAVPGIAEATGFDPQRPLTADAHHRARAAARELLTPAQRRAAQLAALDAAAGHGIVAVHECGGPDIGGLDDWHALHALEHGVEVTGYWGEAVQTAEQARDADRRHRRGRPGRGSVRRRRAGLAHRLAA